MPISISPQGISQLRLTALVALAFGGCVQPLMPPRWADMNPTDPSSSLTSDLPVRPTLIVETKQYLDPSVGREVTEMKHDMPGMGSNAMQGMDHGDNSKTMSKTGTTNEGMENMDHKPMSSTTSTAENIKESSRSLSNTDSVLEEMENTADEMKKTSDEMKAKSNVVKKSIRDME